MQWWKEYSHLLSKILPECTVIHIKVNIKKNYKSIKKKLKYQI